MGSDGATFNPYIQKEETLYFFNDQLCRAMPLVFEKKVTASTLPGYRFVPHPDVFMSPKSVPENDCYCVDETLCEMVGDGMFGVSKCQVGSSYSHETFFSIAFLSVIKILESVLSHTC